MWWEIRSILAVEIGLDPIRGFKVIHIMPSSLIRYIYNMGIYFLNNILVKFDPIYLNPTWSCSCDLGLYGELVDI